ncbi:MAG TPA: lysylphosphatidylglycerol synthase transmembrane domain-containing protein [Vicinamibacterales bacterium]|mgnify:FL=1|nr:lysylphosphatidylglycerol synthase transmembrane domain-containing protein [Vicinamibacterales bacterium]HPW21182.1 lysylphosphatidylglycerol synthase transmembrane domain-containing protein [Vicinamibacterales bacterium]
MRALSSIAARLVVTGAVLAYLLSRIDLGASARAMVHVHPVWLLLALALVAADRVVMALRWLLLLRAAGVDAPPGSTLRIFFESSFVGSFLPAGIGADAARAYAIAVRTSHGSQAVASVGVDRLIGLATIVLVGVAGLAGWAYRLPPGLRLRLYLVAAAAGAGVVALFWVDRLIAKLLPPRWREFKWGWRVSRLGDAIGAYRAHPGILARVFALSLGVGLVRVLQAYCLGCGLDIGVGFGYYLVFMPIAMLILLLPVSISGLGVLQAVVVWLLRPVGVPDAQAFALSTLLIAIGLAGNLPGALLYVVRRKPII